MAERRDALGGFLPHRRVRAVPISPPPGPISSASSTRARATARLPPTMAFVRQLNKLMDDKEIGKFVVPIVPDEARTFGMDALFRKYGIYAHRGQLYEPVDSHLLLYYRESQRGATSRGGHHRGRGDGVLHGGRHRRRDPRRQHDPVLPLLFDVRLPAHRRLGLGMWRRALPAAFWSAARPGAPARSREGLQHQDGHSHLLASTFPSLISYDPAFAYEISVIVRDGIERMYHKREPVFYYITVENEPYVQPAKPEGVDEGILKGSTSSRQRRSRVIARAFTCSAAARSCARRWRRRSCWMPSSA